MNDHLPAERAIKALAEVPISNGAEYLRQSFVLKGIDIDDVETAREAG